MNYKVPSSAHASLASAHFLGHVAQDDRVRARAHSACQRIHFSAHACARMRWSSACSDAISEMCTRTGASTHVQPRQNVLAAHDSCVYYRTGPRDANRKCDSNVELFTIQLNSQRLATHSSLFLLPDKLHFTLIVGHRISP